MRSAKARFNTRMFVTLRRFRSKRIVAMTTKLPRKPSTPTDPNRTGTTIPTTLSNATTLSVSGVFPLPVFVAEELKPLVMEFSGKILLERANVRLEDIEDEVEEL